MLDALRPEDLENVASNIHGSDLYALAEQARFCKAPQPPRAPAQLVGDVQYQDVLLRLQIVFQVMSSPEEAGIWSQSLVALFDRITEPGAHDKGFAQPLGGSSGPGKAFRSSPLHPLLWCAVQHASMLYPRSRLLHSTHLPHKLLTFHKVVSLPSYDL